MSERSVSLPLEDLSLEYLCGVLEPLAISQEAVVALN